MYNNIYDGQTSYCQNPRANAYIFSEYNLFTGCKDICEVTSGGVVKSFNDSVVNCRGNAQATVVSSKTEKVSNNCLYGDFDTNASLSYIPSGSYALETNTDNLVGQFETDGGCMDEDAYSLGGSGNVDITPSETTTTTQTTAPSESTTTTTTATTPSTGTTVYGDVNCDGSVDIRDVLLLNQNLLIGKQLTAAGTVNADVDKDGKPTMTDALNILQHTIGLVKTLPIA
jgi:hypothetical protein